MRFRTRVRSLAAGGVATLGVAMLAGASGATTAASLPALVPTVSDYAQITHSATPPSEAQCESVGRTCFTPASTRSAYDIGPLYRNGFDGTGVTIAVVDAYGSDTITHDLKVYDDAFALPHLCGEEGQPSAASCPADHAWFKRLAVQGAPATKAPPSTSQGAGLEDKAAWALEVSLDVEVAHSIAPGANILLVTTPTAETLGAQGFATIMNAEQYVIDHHLAQVVTQSFGAAEGSFGSATSLLSLRHAFQSAPAAGVTVLASSGDDGNTGYTKQPVHSGGIELQNSVGWPASDPLVTTVGGTYLCTDPNASQDQPRTNYAVRKSGCVRGTDAEVAWTFSGGGFSSVFPAPAYQSGVTGNAMRGVPDVALQASAGTGALVYLTLPPDGLSGLFCGTDPCSTGWYDIGGTSLSAPQYAGIVALANQYAAQAYGQLGLGFINDDLYKIAADPSAYASDFYDVTQGDNDVWAAERGLPRTTYKAAPGWDAVTGLGTPSVANLVPALAASATGH